MRVRTVLQQCAHALYEAGVGSVAGSDADARAVAAHEARVLFAEAFSLTSSDVQAAVLMDKRVEELDWAVGARAAESSPARSHDSLTFFAHWVARRCQREPLQRIVGHAPFRYLDLKVGPGVFIPRPETELLVDEALEYAKYVRARRAQEDEGDERGEGPEGAEGAEKARPLRIVDLCAGSGALGLAAATEIPGSEVWAVELSETAYAYTQKNADLVRGAHPDIRVRYDAIRADATSSETLEDLDGTVDILLSNPPYIPQKDIPEQIEAREYDPALALYGASDDGMKVPAAIIRRASMLLKPGGLLLMEHDWQQGETTRAVAEECGFEQVQTKKDFAGKDRYLYAVKSS
ncbi:protein-(glutamine-N5) methyltransferase, release factor-specific [Alloscardovia macacae]|uniref:Protein-(Glutamine-N5) methyltransferase, release factor-specific n=1 Tax=Alloscardovia macacae TaxID=1160091 RepID=A0A1Y2SVE8_9BIFI|nr:protein-(glutamine-N5) methyltransferase, release factor-specific [Alloscardovia macacae]OTA28613.1 protein-(glutamine-N5) methyltransferase, release factor-specific [Alloscardovia macacae]